MLQITIPASEIYDERKNEFITGKEQVLQLEHSLLSLSKWESKWCKPFLEAKGLTREETLDYVRCMTITQNVDPQAYERLTNKNLEEITAYITAPMSATWITERTGGPQRKEIITSEVIYYWMIALQIPFECQKWHLNRLLKLIRVCNEKNSPPKKRSARDIMAQNSKLNAARKAQLGSHG